MEQEGIDVLSVELVDGNINIKYANDATETLPNNEETFRLFYNTWLKDNPPFISDIHKITMRNIILASINNNPKSIDDLKQYFSSPNEDQVRKFIDYMRKRVNILPEKKAIWKTVVPDAS
jgi:hypothetical protein